MADVTAAIEQDQVAESLLGDPQPEPSDNQVGPETEQPEQAETQQVEQETQPEESADDWLPQEQDRTFTDEALLRYAQRYQKDEQWLSDPLNRQLLVDKLNSDIYLRQQQEQQEFEVPEVETQQTQPQDAKVPTLEEHLDRKS